MDRSINLENQIHGWGVDLDPANRPAYPKEKVPVHGTGAHWEVPDQQVPKIKIHRSIEHTHLTPVFGTSSPPRGLSGRIRDLSYAKYSEARPMHWMLLLAADRIDVIEGLFSDLRRGYIPNIFAEKGLRAEMKYNPAGFQKRMLVWGLMAGVAIGGISLLFGRRRKLSREEERQPYDVEIDSRFDARISEPYVEPELDGQITS